MLESAIPVKTAAGRQEIDERKHKLGPRHRMVLISINDAVEKPVSGLNRDGRPSPAGSGISSFSVSVFASSDPLSWLYRAVLFGHSVWVPSIYPAYP